MRGLALAAMLGFGMLQLPGGLAAASADQTAPPNAQASSASSSAASDAAARHAKLTACLKQAKAKKLVGADKTGFVKNCRAAP